MVTGVGADPRNFAKIKRWLPMISARRPINQNFIPGISASEFYQDKPSVNICTWLPPAAGFTKIVSFAAPRLRFMIEDCG